jgi:hypothetical protein
MLQFNVALVQLIHAVHRQILLKWMPQLGYHLLAVRRLGLMQWLLAQSAHQEYGLIFQNYYRLGWRYESPSRWFAKPQSLR